MFHIVIVLFLLAGGGPVVQATGRTVYDTKEACEAVLNDTDVTNSKSPAGYKQAIEAQIGQETRMEASCVEAE